MNFKRLFLALSLLLATAISAQASLGEQVKKIKCGKGVTLTGVVYCGDEPVEGVAVTDGSQIVRTDSNGIYRIASTKPYGLVYISTPSGYEPTRDRNIIPHFWAKTTLAPKKRERHDFELRKVADSRFSIFMCADSHFCNDTKRGDLAYFSEHHMPIVQSVYNEVKSNPVYTIFLGDITWDQYWVRANFDLDSVPEFLNENNYPMPVYTIMGNHDNDPSIPAGENTDFLAANRYRNVFGPTFYSMDKGGVHFVMLDNIVYKNTVKAGEKLKPGVVGSRNYEVYVDEAQLDWLRKDLASVDKSTTLVVCMHSPLRRLSEKGNASRAFKKGTEEALLAILKDFADVRIFAGHMHQSHCLKIGGYPNITEYTTPSVCGELWKTPNETGRNFCDDGTLAGFTLCTFDGGKLTDRVYYGQKGETTPIRMYDMNSVAKYYAESKDAPMLHHLCELLPNQKYYAAAEFAGYVYINCWYCDRGVKVEATEAGKPLEVEKVKSSDPWSAVAILGPAMKKKHKINKRNNKLSIVEHLYRVKPESADTPVTVTVTTPYGTKYTQTLERPAAFPAFDK